ncbi:MAG: hypothetical protein FWF96_01145 [Kiritimatiellaeota bacterium]|nr:hypothetical protein [Kiritimatiellota bacterium]
MNAPHPTGELQRRHRSQAREQPVWLIGSVAVHALLLVIVVGFTPLRDRLFAPRERAPAPMTPKQLQELADKIEELKQNDLLNNVRDILADLHEFDDIRQEMGAHYMEFAEHGAENAVDEITALLAQLEPQQQHVLRDMQAVEPELAASDAMDDSHARHDEFQKTTESAHTRQMEALRNQIPPLDTLDKALSIAQMAGMEKTAEALHDLLQKQTLAHDLQEAAQKTNELTRHAHHAVQHALHIKAPDADVAEKRQAADVLRADMTPAQNEAKAAQEAALIPLQEIREIVQNETPRPEANAELFNAQSPVSHAQLPRMDTVDLYDTAVRLEQHILEAYRDVRATERAILHTMSIQNARRLTDVAATTRPEINRELLRSEVRTVEQFDQRKEAVAQAIRETASIHQSVATLLETVRRIARSHDDFTVDLALEWAQEEEEFAEAVTAEEIEDDYADIAELMRQAMEDGAEQPYQPNRPPPENQNETNEEENQNAPPRRRPSQMGALFTQLLNAARRQGPPRTVFRAFPPRVDPRAALPHQIWGARTVGPGGIDASWLGLTTWHIIGPFPNPARANIDRKFPPETIVDLDATYEGKNGPVSWEFYMCPMPQVVIPLNWEPYGIWYGYTEIRFDRACDLWVAIGSDDKSKIWVNDFCIWESAPQHKGWRPNEGFRRIHFRKGVNRILYRCENGHHAMGWSFVINLNPEARE